MRLAIERSIGEIRVVAIDECERPVSLFFWRHRQLDPRARPGDILPAIVRSVDKGRSHVFVELETGETGFFNLSAKHKAPDVGARLNVLVRSESHGDKSALVRPVSDEPHLTDFDTALNVWAETLSISLKTPDDICVGRSLLDDAIDEALNPKVILQGGGDIYIEYTRGLTSVDIDSSGRRPELGGLNQTALTELARQISLRRISGLIVIDLVGAPKSAKAVELRDLFRRNLKSYGLKQAEILLPSALGVVEASVTRVYRPLAEMVSHKNSAHEDDLEVAITCFRSILRTGEDNRSARIRVVLSRRLYYFLKQAVFDWQSALASKIGHRFELEVRELSELTGFEIRVL